MAFFDSKYELNRGVILDKDSVPRACFQVRMFLLDPAVTKPAFSNFGQMMLDENEMTLVTLFFER